MIERLVKITVGAVAAIVLALGVASSASAAGTLRQPPSCTFGPHYIKSGADEYSWTYASAFNSAGKAGFVFNYVHTVNGVKKDYGQVTCVGK